MSQRFTLRSFATAEPEACVSVSVEIGASWVLEYRVNGIDSLEWPGPVAQPTRRDGLWHHTCGECFVADPSGSGYLEFNFSPSGDWAAYRFADVRRDMRQHEWPGPSPQSEQIAMGAWRVILPIQALGYAGSSAVRRRIGLSVVARGARGHSYWALHHPGAQPNFHDPAGFIASLEVPGP